jgi:tRNA (mo5U34)-methyltransferase
VRWGGQCSVSRIAAREAAVASRVAREGLAVGDGDVEVEELRARVEALRPSFHSPFDFGAGIVTKPAHVQRRFRRRLRLMQIPKDLTGKTVLDIGAWDGFFSFELERRGAKRVLAIDTWGGDGKALDCLLLAREHFKSNIEYRRLDAENLSPAAVGTFDLVLCAGVLYHLRYPLLTLERIRSVTAGKLILETNSLIPALHERVPLITFFPGDEDQVIADRKRFPWHRGAFPTQSWVSYALTTAGFSRHRFVYTPSFKWLKKMAAGITNVPQYGRLIVHGEIS